MTGKIDINSIDELLNSIEILDDSENNIESEDEDIEYCSDYNDSDNISSIGDEEEFEKFKFTNIKDLENFIFFESYIENINDKDYAINNEIINIFKEKNFCDLDLNHD